MKNKKKTNAAKKNSTPPGAGQSVKKVGQGLVRLVTTKKGVGLLALATLGLGYLAKRRKARGTAARPNGAVETDPLTPSGESPATARLDGR